MSILLALICVAALAWANGANDNFKGVATLFGSGVADYRRALSWATAATLAGSVAAIWLSAHLVAAFSGKLFVSAATLALPGFPLAVCAACAGTVLLATRLGLPISTTHALAGALLGAAFVAPESTVDWGRAGRQIFLPLALGPLLSVGAALLLYPALSASRRALGIGAASCACIGEQVVLMGNGMTALETRIGLGKAPECRNDYAGAVLGITAGPMIDRLHWLSAGLVSFARGVNDTPKLVALVLMTAPLLHGGAAFVAVGVAIALGGLLGARRVAQTMSTGITDLNPGQGFTANLITSGLVLAASPLGLPLSTTHVSCGALFGIGAVTRQARWKTIAGIGLAWVVTLPIAALLGAGLLRGLLLF